MYGHHMHVMPNNFGNGVPTVFHGVMPQYYPEELTVPIIPTVNGVATFPAQLQDSEILYSYPNEDLNSWNDPSPISWNSVNQQYYSSQDEGTVYVKCSVHPDAEAEIPPFPAPKPAVSFCEQSYPVSSPSDDTPFVTVRKCKKREKKIKIEDPSITPERKKSTPLNANTPSFKPAFLQAESSVSAIEKKLPSFPSQRPIPNYGIPMSYGHNTNKPVLQPRTSNSLPAGQLSQMKLQGGSKFVTREWRPTIKPFNSDSRPKISSSASVPQPYDSAVAFAGVSAVAKEPKEFSTVAAPPADIVSQEECNPNEPHSQSSAGKFNHGTRGLIEVPAELKADVFGHEPDNSNKDQEKAEEQTDDVADKSRAVAPVNMNHALQHVQENQQSHNAYANRKGRKQIGRVTPKPNQNSHPPPAASPKMEQTRSVTTGSSMTKSEVVSVPVIAESPTPATDVTAAQNTPSEERTESDVTDVHMLETCWTLYHMNGATRRKGVDWNASIQTIGVFDTVESFFFGFNSTPKASETAKQQDYMFFRGGQGDNKSTPIIRAAWEDERNTNGGMWRFTIPMQMRGPAKSSEVIDFCWKEMFMALIGEQFDEHNDLVNGCYFCNRGDEYRLQVWMACNNPIPVTEVGVRLAELLQLKDGVHFDYVSHEESNKKGNRYAKPLHDQQEIYRILAGRQQKRQK